MNGDRQRLRGHYDEDFYWERVDRNLGWLGDTTEEQRERQARLRDAVIGIVGTGGHRRCRSRPPGAHGRTQPETGRSRPLRPD